MIPSFPSSENLDPLPVYDRSMFMNIVFSDIRYRIRTRQYFNITVYLRMWIMLWLSTSIADIGILFDVLLTNNGVIFLISMTFSLFILAYYAFKKRVALGKGLWISFVSFGVVILLSTIFLILDIKYFIFLVLAIGLEQVINLIAWQGSRPILIMKTFIYVQLLLVSIKMDHQSIMTWEETLLVFLLIWFTCISLLLGIIFFLVLRFCYFERSFRGYKYFGLAFITLNCLSLLLMTSIPLSLSKNFNHILLRMPILCMFSLLMNFVNFFFQLRFKNKILLFFCSIQQVKSFNQIINLIRMQESAMIKKFAKKGENWYQPQSESPADNSKVSTTTEKCLICLEVDPIMLWMPCGHLTVCEGCAGKLIQSKNINCILCKIIPTEIYEVECGMNTYEICSVTGYHVQII